MFKDDLEDYSDAGKLLARANQIMEGIETSNVKPLLEFLTNNKVTDNTTNKPNSPDEIINTNSKKSSESVVETI
jgi:transcription initiation factor TFIID subunit TAF12